MYYMKPHKTVVVAIAALLVSCQQFVIAQPASAAPPCSRLREYRIWQLQGGKELPPLSQSQGDMLAPDSHEIKHLKRDIATAFGYAWSIYLECNRETEEGIWYKADELDPSNSTFLRPRKDEVQANVKALRAKIADIRLITSKEMDPKVTHDIAQKSWVELGRAFDQIAYTIDLPRDARPSEKSLQSELDKQEWYWNSNSELDKCCDWSQIRKLSLEIANTLMDGTGDLMQSVESNESSTSR